MDLPPGWCELVVVFICLVRCRLTLPRCLQYGVTQGRAQPGTHSLYRFCSRSSKTKGHCNCLQGKGCSWGWSLRVFMSLLTMMHTELLMVTKATGCQPVWQVDDFIHPSQQPRESAAIITHTGHWNQVTERVTCFGSQSVMGQMR